jgi:hypothetical protein
MARWQLAASALAHHGSPVSVLLDERTHERSQTKRPILRVPYKCTQG